MTALAGLARAETEAQRAHRAGEIIAAVNSPFCPASTLASCSSPQAAAWRREIQQWVDEGLTKVEICTRLEVRVGHRLCAMPRSPFASTLPILLSLGAIGVLGLLLRRLVRPALSRAAVSSGPDGSQDDTTSDLDVALDRELAALDDGDR